MVIRDVCKALGFAVLALAIAVSGFDSSVQADDTVDWSWFLETTGGDASWDSGSPFIDTSCPAYGIEIEITLAEIDVAGIPVPLDVLGLFDDTTESGVLPGPLPFALIADTIDYDGDGAEDPTLVDYVLGIDGAGEGHGSFSGVTLGTFSGLPILALRLGGTLHVECVPEPSTLALLSFAGIATVGFVRRRRKC